MATIEQNLTQLVQDRDDLVTNLTTKGITGLTGDETFTELVPEVLNIPSGSGHDWSAIGYSGEPQTIQDDYDYAKDIYDNWDSSLTNYTNKYNGNRKIVYMPLVDTSNGTNFYGMFRDSTVVYMPQLDTSNGTIFSYMFKGCNSLRDVPQLNTSNGTSFGNMFNGCALLTTIPQLDTSNGTYFDNMFDGSHTNLITIPQLNLGKATSITNIFTVLSASYYPKFTTFGGFKDLGKSYLTSQSANYSFYTLTLSCCVNLTHDSLMNVINNLWDIATAGVQTQQLKLGSTNLAKLSADEIAIATNKGWTVS